MMAQPPIYKIITVADSKYLNMVKVMISSAVIHFPEAALFVELVNVKKEDRVIVQSLHPSIQVRNTQMNFDNGNQKRCYCCGQESVLFKEFRAKSNDILIWIDADTIIRKSCEDFCRIVTESDFSASQKSGNGRIRTGVYSFNNTPIANQFMHEYVSKCEKSNKWWLATGDTIGALRKTWAVWMTGTNVLSELFPKFEARLKFIDLPVELYSSCKLSDDAIMWSGVGKNKTSKRWLEESKKYVQ